MDHHATSNTNITPSHPLSMSHLHPLHGDDSMRFLGFYLFLIDFISWNLAIGSKLLDFGNFYY